MPTHCALDTHLHMLTRVHTHSHAFTHTLTRSCALACSAHTHALPFGTRMTCSRKHLICERYVGNFASTRRHLKCAFKDFWYVLYVLVHTCWVVEHGQTIWVVEHGQEPGELPTVMHAEEPHGKRINTCQLWYESLF